MNQGLTPGNPGAATDRNAATAAEPWVTRFAPLVRPGGRVLDIACGNGRHARLFRDRGHPVTALDRDIAGVADLAGQPDAEVIAADLEQGSAFPLAGRRFAAIVGVNYLHRPLFPLLIETLESGGVLIWRTFARGNERFGKPSNPAFLLHPGELLEAVRGRLTVVAYEHGEVTAPHPAVIQRICAVAAQDGEPPKLV